MTAFSDETGRDWLPLKYEDGEDFCTVTDAKGASFALTLWPDRMKQMEAALSAAPVGEPKPVTDLVDDLAKWLHEETAHPESYPDHTWPETDRDDGRRSGGWVKIVPLHVQEYFRDIARRLDARYRPRYVAQEPVVAWSETDVMMFAGRMRGMGLMKPQGCGEIEHKMIAKLLAEFPRYALPTATPAGLGLDEIARDEYVDAAVGVVSAMALCTHLR